MRTLTGPSAMPRYLAFLAVVAMGSFVLNVHFLPIAEFGEDGFQSQLFRVLVSFQQDSLLVDGAENPLVFVHILRTLAVAPFLIAEAFAGAPAQLTMLCMVLIPLVRRMHRQSGSLFSLLPLVLPLAISGRAVLVAAGIAYIVTYLLSPRASRLYLILGGLWVMLSSASILMALLLLAFATSRDRTRHYGMTRWFMMLALALALGASAADKIVGFQSGQAGYAANGIDSNNVVLVALSRSTVITSFIDGNYLRGLVYGLLSLYVLAKAVVLMISPGRGEMRRIVLCCLPGVPMEGLGMLALIFPLLWLFINYDPAVLGMPVRK